MEDFSHVSVLLRESIEALCVKPDGIYVDMTTGGGGHSLEIAKRLTHGKLICIDRDADALNAARERLKQFSDKITVVKDNFQNVGSVLDGLGIDKIDGAIADLGVSSYQFDTAERGFSYRLDAPLDMRMDVSSPLTAYDVVNTYTEDDLKRIIYDYGEEGLAPKISAEIVRRRDISPIKTTAELADLICSCYPPKLRAVGHHPAKKTFQAIRIEVNAELDAIEPAIKQVTERLNAGGRIAVITFHSLEDRIVKNTFAELAKGCTCPPSFPVCVCGRKPKINIISKKPILPKEEELNDNRRSHSAKLRVAEKAGNL